MPVGTGVLQQLRALEAAHLVSRQTVRHGVGRPRHLYDVTPDAQDLFPSNYDALAAGLLAAIEAVGGDDLLDEVFAARRCQLGDRVRGQLAERVADGAPLDDRVRELAVIQAEQGYLAEASVDADGDDPAARAQLRHLPRRARARRLPARPSWNCSARSSAPTSSARRTSPRATAAAPTGSRNAPET